MGSLSERHRRKIDCTQRGFGDLVRRTVVSLVVVAASCFGGLSLAQAPDDHPYFTDEFSIGEGQGPARISVQRDSGAGDVTVTYATKPSNAKEGADYSPARGQLHFPAGDAGPKTFEVHVADDGEPEEEESLLLLLYGSGGNIIDFSELTIVSNESEPEESGDGSQTGGPQGSGPGTASRPGSPSAGAGLRSSRGPAAGPATGPADASLAQGIGTIELVPRPGGPDTEGENDDRAGNGLAAPSGRQSRTSAVGSMAVAAVVLSAVGFGIYLVWSWRTKKVSAA